MDGSWSGLAVIEREWILSFSNIVCPCWILRREQRQSTRCLTRQDGYTTRGKLCRANTRTLAHRKRLMQRLAGLLMLLLSLFG